MRNSTKIKLIVILLLIVIFIIQSGFLKDINFITGSVTKEEIPYEEGEYFLYFCPNDNCENVMLDFVKNAKEIKCVFYEINLEELINLLEEKNAEVLIFEENYKGFGLPVSSRGLMHNKFCIADNEMVITGSTNPTENGVKRNNNNLFIIRSENLYKNYLDEFYEIKKERKEGKVRYPYINHEGFIIENYFCPEDECEEMVVEEIKKAKRSIHFMTFSFTSDAIGNSILEKKNLDIKGVFEKRQENSYSEYSKMKEAEIDVKLDGNPSSMHHKVFIIDRYVVVFGSYNPTKNGNENNDENILIIHNPSIAELFEKEFDKVYNEGE